MTRIGTEIGTIRYNPERACFEALVTFHEPGGPRRVAASIAAPLNADFDRLADGLWQDAMSGEDRPDHLQSRRRAEAKSSRPSRGGFDWVAFLYGPRAA